MYYIVDLVDTTINLLYVSNELPGATIYLLSMSRNLKDRMQLLAC
jgi:hypothetical protein